MQNIFKTVQLPKRTIVGISQRIAPSSNPSAQIGQFWQSFFMNGYNKKIEHAIKPMTVCSLYTDYAPDGSYTHTIGIPVTKIEKLPENLVRIAIPAGSYACWQFNAPPATAVPQLWKDVWTSKDYEQLRAQRIFTVDFEEYPFPFDNSAKTAFSVYVAIQ
jgi:predicted transcriptional regulator YdeE